MGTGVSVACDALRSDAMIWSRAADATRGAARSAGRLVLGPDKLGAVAQERGLVAAYEALRRTIADLLGGGGTELDDLGGTVRQAADTYEREDHAGAHRVSRAGEDR